MLRRMGFPHLVELAWWSSNRRYFHNFGGCDMTCMMFGCIVRMHCRDLASSSLVLLITLRIFVGNF